MTNNVSPTCNNNNHFGIDCFFVFSAIIKILQSTLKCLTQKREVNEGKQLLTPLSNKQLHSTPPLYNKKD